MKKTRWQGAGNCELRFSDDQSANPMSFKNNGKTTEIKVAPGLPKDSRPNNKSLFENVRAPRGLGQVSSPAKTIGKAQLQSSTVSKVNPPSNMANIVSQVQTVQLNSASTLPQSLSMQSKFQNYGSKSSLASTADVSLANSKFGSGALGSANNLTKSQNNILAAAAAKKKPPPPPAKKNVPKCEALFVTAA